MDIFLPRKAELRRLEEMTSEELSRKARRSERGLEENIMAIFCYKDPLVKAAIWQIKYRGHQKIGRLLADILHSELMDELSTLSQFSDFTSPILIPIPLSKERFKKRGYNQSEDLAREVAKMDGKSFDMEIDALIKIRETAPQSSLTRTLRLKNLKGCFKVARPEKVHGRNIILIDDVMTTGATFREAMDTLKKAGARKVIAIAAAG